MDFYLSILYCITLFVPFYKILNCDKFKKKLLNTYNNIFCITVGVHVVKAPPDKRRNPKVLR